MNNSEAVQFFLTTPKAGPGMRAFLVFDPMNDLVFNLADDKFYKHVAAVAMCNGFIDSPKEKVSTDILVHLFAPLLTSQKIYKTQLNNPCACIQCDNETLILFTEYLGYTAIYICNSREGRQGTEKRRVNTLLQCVWHLYACALPQLRTHFRFDKPRAQLLKNMMKAYDELKRSSIPWLVEAHSYYPYSRENQKLLEEILASARHKTKNAPLTFSHAMLFHESQCLMQHHAGNALKLSTTDLFHLSLVANIMDMNSYLPMFFSTNFNTAVPFLVVRLDTVCQGTVILLAELNELTARSDALYALSRHVNHIQGEAFKGEHIDVEHITQQTALIRNMMTKVYRVMQIKPMTEAEKMMLAHIKLIIRETFDSGLFYDTLNDMPKNKDSDNSFLLNQKLSDLQEKVTAAFSELVLDCASAYQPHSSLFWLSVPHIVARLDLKFDLRSVFGDIRQLEGFIFVNRTANRTICGLADEKNTQVKHCLQRAWKKAERIVGEGQNFGFTWSDERCRYRYDIWFENLSGRKVTPLYAPRSKFLPYPGVGAVNFYKLLTEELFENQAKNVTCLEVLMIGSNHAPLADDIVSRMSAKMWNLIAKTERSRFHVF
ncbi:uncharacterized protein LOC111269323 [Varroa jacobsoni]|uniref:FUZ/MON1/HPS1 first Longin domain-containing protein n=1 Tax=Varroa destructor TaxID=109461 RepID=A0A7M7JXC2_VARDE|nr:uncharacterized protein LOC111248990 [Varroa destructor]XP_022704549.1 uncharacterized protein LOC111269323 [Varroa jacobsoni]